MRIRKGGTLKFKKKRKEKKRGIKEKGRVRTYTNELLISAAVGPLEVVTQSLEQSLTYRKGA